MAEGPKPELLPGTLELLILQTLDLAEPEHGWGVARRVHQLSGETFEVNQGSLYPALRRLEGKGWISARWGTSDAGRRARFYRLTGTGRRQLHRERERWSLLVAGVNRVLRAGEAGWTG